MIDELEVTALDLCLDDDGYDWCDGHQELLITLQDIGVFMPKSIILLIHEFCKPGITLVLTSDGGEFAVNTKALELSKLLKIQAELNPHTFRVDNISGEIFSYISAYLNHHNGVEPAKIRKPILWVQMSRNVEDQWDADFADSVPKAAAFQIILAANYIHCESLLHLMCAKIATLIKGKSPEEIRHILSEESDDRTEQKNEPEENQSELLTIVAPEDINLEPLILDDPGTPMENGHINLESVILDDPGTPIENEQIIELEFEEEHHTGDIE